MFLPRSELVPLVRIFPFDIDTIQPPFNLWRDLVSSVAIYKGDQVWIIVARLSGYSVKCVAIAVGFSVKGDYNVLQRSYDSG